MQPDLPHSHYRLKRGEKIALVIAPALCIQWLVCRALGWNLPTPWEPVLPGLAIFGAAFVLSWAAELAQLDMPQSLALAFVALVAVLPEYAVDMYFAWTAGKNPSYVAYAAANMTGGNRLLIGAGWTLVIFAYWMKTKHRYMEVPKAHRLELAALMTATLYSFVIPLKRTISWVDSAFLLSLFGIYMFLASRPHGEPPEFEEGPAAWLAQKSKIIRRAATLLFFILAGTTIFLSAHPFAEGLLSMGRHFKIEEFLLVQWLAPLASEAPEFIVATLFAIRKRPGAGVATLLSSTVNQWTLLVGMLPIAYMISSHKIQPMVLDVRQTEELLLTSAQSIFATIILCDLRFSIRDGIAILVLFLTQFLVIHPASRYLYSGLYLLFAAGVMLASGVYRRGFVATFRDALGNSLTPPPV
jgi:cation:H+ antiporter